MGYDNFTVGQAIRKLRMDNHMSIGELADAVDRSPAHLNMIELGSRKISFDLLFALMAAFHTDANSVLGVLPKEEHTQSVSVDERLRQLVPEQRAFFTDAFLHMLDNIPA